MFIYQVAIMAVVITLAFVLVFAIKLRRSVLFVSIVGLVLVGSFALTMIQDYFSFNKYYSQKVDPASYARLKLTAEQKGRLGSLLKGYRAVSPNQEQCRAAYEKTHTVVSGKFRSTIRAGVLLYGTPKEAYDYLKLRQKISDDKVLLPEDPQRSRKDGERTDFHYLTSYVRSGYENPGEILYVPSHVYYMSEVIIQQGNVVFDLVEKANRPETVKNQVIEQLIKLLNAKQ